MSKETKQKKSEESDKVLIDEMIEQFSKADTAFKEIRDGGFNWNDRENLFFGRYKNSKEDTKSVLSTGDLTTLAIDGSCRVMAQMPNGRFYNFSGDTGSNMLMNLLFEHYIIPNATSGGPLLLKLRMADMYSRVFPYIPAFIDWKVVEDRYIGPDLIVIHPRRFRPQPGKTAIEDMDYCFIDTEVSKGWLEKRDKEVWKNIDEVIKSSDEGTGTPEDDRSPKEKGKTKTGITLRHRFLSDGRWTVYEPTSQKVVVDEEKWFPCIPIALKLQYPRLDQLAGITDFDRGEMSQKAIDSLFRFYIDGVGMSIDPPAVMDPEDVVLSSIVRQPKAKWFVKSGKVDSIKMQTVSPQGLSTFQSTYQILKSNMLSMGAQSDTSVPKSIDPGFGRTPKALQMQGDRQGARDAWDTFMMEQFIERTYTIMADMIAMKGVKPYAFNLLGNSIRRIKEEYPDENFELLGSEFEKGKVSVSNEAIQGKYRYVIDSGSMAVKKDDTGKKLIALIELYAKYPQIQADLLERGQKINFGEAFKRVVIDEGITDSDKIIVTANNPESVEGVGDEGATVDPNAAATAGVGEQIPPEAQPNNQEVIAQ